MIACDAASLIEQAKCYKCIPPGAVDDVSLYLLCQWTNNHLLHTEAEEFVEAWVDGIVAGLGVSPSAPTIAAVHDFVESLIDTSIWPKMITMNVVVPDSVAISLYPLVHNGGYNPYLPYYSGAPVQPLLTVNGWKYPSSANGIDTGIVPATHFNNATFGCTVYCSENPSDAAARTMGCGEGAAAQPHTSIYTNQAGNLYGFVHRFGIGLNPTALPANPWPGYLSVNRQNANLIRLFIARADTPHKQQGFGVTANTNAPTALWRFLIFSFNMAGVPESATTTKRISFFALHQPLTLAESATLFTAVQALRTAFGGGYV